MSVNSLDIFNPQISQVASGLEGKVILVYGGNNLGKTKQATRMKKPFYLPFEKGLAAIAGIPNCPINSWADFIKINNQLTGNATVAKAREMYSTIIFDEVEAAANYCQEFICTKYESSSISEGNNGYGLWKEYATEFWKQINKLLGAGYCVYFIAHAQQNKDGYFSPKADTRAISPIMNNCDVCIYVKSNGVDENGRVVHSTGYTAETPNFFARSRFDYIDTVIPDFTAENLEKAVVEAIKRQEDTEGIKTVSYEEQKEQSVVKHKSYEELMDEMQSIGESLAESGHFDDLTRIVEAVLGKGKKASDLKKGQEEVIEVVIENLKEFMDSLPEEKQK